MTHGETTQQGAEDPDAAVTQPPGEDAQSAPAGAGEVAASAPPAADRSAAEADAPGAMALTKRAADSPPVDSPPADGSSFAGGAKSRLGDRIFTLASSGSGAFVVLLVVLIGVFLVVKAIPALVDNHVNFFTSRVWSVSSPPLEFGIVGLLWSTVLAALIAMVLAVPIAIGIALFMTQYAPKQLSRPVAYVIDLLAAIPSIIYGIWGVTVLTPALHPVQNALFHLGAFPLFKGLGVQGTIFDGGVVLAIMILPIVTAVSRDVFERTPTTNIEAALALGATKWEMIRMAVLPYGRPGVISGAMLGLGRALGETIALLLIISTTAQDAPFHVSIFDGGQTIAAKIAGDSAEFPGHPGPYIAAGLVLFVLTFVVNAAARAIVNRRKEFTE